MWTLKYLLFFITCKLFRVTQWCSQTGCLFFSLHQRQNFVLISVNPSEPLLTAEQETFYLGQEATIRCTGNVGIPGQEILLKQNSEALPESLLDKETQINKETCENITTVQYSFIVTMNDDGSSFSCETGTLASTTLTVNVSEPSEYISILIGLPLKPKSTDLCEYVSYFSLKVPVETLPVLTINVSETTKLISFII